MMSEDVFETLLANYKLDKDKYNDIKRKVDKQGTEIKNYMNELGIDSFTGKYGYVAKISKSTRTSIDEDMLLTLLKQSDIVPEGLIKTKEYVDTDMLENLIYKGDIDPETLKLISSCVTEKEVVQLRVSNSK